MKDIDDDYKKIVEDYKNDKMGYEEIKKKLDNTKILKMFKNISNIESKMNKNEKFAKMLEKVLNEIITNRIYKKSRTKKKIIDITWIDNPKQST